MAETAFSGEREFRQRDLRQAPIYPFFGFGEAVLHQCLGDLLQQNGEGSESYSQLPDFYSIILKRQVRTAFRK